MAEATTEQKEEKAGNYSGMLYTATVTAEGAGAVCEEETKVDITDAGIRLNLMRIGIINRSPKHQPVNLKEISEEQFKEFQCDGLPEINLSYYKYALTSLRTGYLYVIDESDNDWSEWEITEGHTLIEIPKDQADKNIRKSTSKSEKLNQYIAQPTDVLYIAFSDFQWSAAYFEKMKTDQAARRQRMQLFDATKHVSKTQQTKVLGPVQAQESVSCDADNPISHNFLENSFTVIKTDEENNEADYEIDTVICLDDPVGIAVEITTTLAHHQFKLNAILVALKIGVHIPDVESSLRKGINPESLQSDAFKLSQAKSLFNLASTWKSIALMNEENREDLVEAWGGLDIKRIDKILGKDLRNKRKAKINNAREALVTYLESDYYKKCELDHSELIAESLADAKQVQLFFLERLALQPHDLDAFLMTKEELLDWKHKDTNKKAIAYITDQLQGKGTIGKIIDQKNILEQIEGNANLLKIVGIANSILEVFDGIKDKGTVTIESLSERINKNILKIEDGSEKVITKVSSLLKQYNKTDFSENTDFIVNFNKKTRKKISKFLSKKSSASQDFLLTKQLVLHESFEKVVESEVTDKASKIFNHPRWKKILRNVSGVNLFFTTVGARDWGKKNSFDRGLTGLKILHSMTGVYVAHQNYLVAKKVISETKILARITKGFNYLGVVLDATDSAYNFWERDYDAASMQAGATGVGLLSVYLLGAGTANSWNIGGWICLLAAAAMGFYAAYLEDSPLERLAKNGILSEDVSRMLKANTGRTRNTKDGKKDSNDPIVLIQRHLSRVERVHKTGFTAWENLTNQYRTLMNIIINGRIKMESNQSIETEIIVNKTSSVEFKKRFNVTQLKISLDFGGFLTSVDDINFHIVHYPEGRNAKKFNKLSSVEVQRYTHSLKLEVEKDKNPKAIYTFNVPEKWQKNHMGYMEESSDIMIMAYLGVSEGRGQFVPIKEENGLPNYIACINALQIERATVGDYRVDYKKDRDSKDNLRDTYKEITNTIGWT